MEKRSKDYYGSSPEKTSGLLRNRSRELLNQVKHMIKTNDGDFRDPGRNLDKNLFIEEFN